MRFHRVYLSGTFISLASPSSSTIPGENFKLEFPRALELSTESLQFTDKSCALSFDPRSFEDPDNYMDSLNDITQLARFQEHLKRTVNDGVCIYQVLDLVDPQVTLKSATLTRSNYPDQPALVCKFRATNSPTDKDELVAYTFDKTEDFDVLTITKKQMRVMAFRDVEIGVPAGFDEPTDFDFKDDYGRIKKPEELKVSRYYATRWCNTIIWKQRFLVQQLERFLKHSAVVSGFASKTNSTATYSHGARMSATDNKCAITFFRASHDDSNYASMYQNLVHMNPHGLCFSGKDLDSVGPMPTGKKLTRAVLAQDRRTKRDTLKCFEEAAPDSKEDVIFAEYLLPFEYKKSDPLRHNPDESKVIANLSDMADYDVFSLTNYARFRDMKVAKPASKPDGLPAEDVGTESDEDPETGEKKKSSIFSGLAGLASAVAAPFRPVAAKASDVYKAMFGHQVKGPQIPFFDAHDGKHYVDRTARHGDIAEKYCRHLYFMRDSFINLGLSQADSLVRKVVPAIEDENSIVPSESRIAQRLFDRRRSFSDAQGKGSDLVRGSKSADGGVTRMRRPAILQSETLSRQSENGRGHGLDSSSSALVLYHGK